MARSPGMSMTVCAGGRPGRVGEGGVEGWVGRRGRGLEPERAPTKDNVSVDTYRLPASVLPLPLSSSRHIGALFTKDQQKVLTAFFEHDANAGGGTTVTEDHHSQRTTHRDKKPPTPCLNTLHTTLPAPFLLHHTTGMQPPLIPTTPTGPLAPSVLHPHCRLVHGRATK